MEIKLISRPDDLTPFMEVLKQQKVLSIDTETTGLDPHTHRIRLIQIAWTENFVLVIDCFSFLPEGLHLVKEALETAAVKVFQNAKFDLQFLIALGVYPTLIFDTMLAAQILHSSGGPDRVNLKSLAQHYLNEDIDKTDQKSDWRGALSQAQITYAAMDAAILLRLRKTLIQHIKENNLVRVAEIEFHCAVALAHMEYSGIHLDREKWRQLTEKTTAEMDIALDELYAFSGRPAVQLTLWGDKEAPEHHFNKNPYVLDLLRKQGLSVAGTSKTDLHPYLNHPLVKALMSYRNTSKSLSTFLIPLPKMIHTRTGRLHPKYGQITAWSGRMSCYAPNVQQIPRNPEFRSCFTAPTGRKLIIADYSQIELRVAAQITKDERMLTAYRNGEDLHLLTASLVLNKERKDVSKEERQAAKAVNFGLIFGMGVAGLQQYAQLSYGVEMTTEEASQFYRRFFEAYTGIKQWHESLKKSPPKVGYTLAGRKFLYSEKTGLPGYCNTPVQGTAADIAKKALGKMARRLIGTDTYIVGMVHDEILLECPEAKADDFAQMLKSTMEQAANSILDLVPSEAEVTIAENWAAK